MKKHIFFTALCILMLEGFYFPAYALLRGCSMLRINNTYSGFLKMDNVKLPSDAVIRRDEKDETIILLHGKNLSKSLETDKSFQKLQTENQYADIAMAFLSAHRSMFKLVRPPDELIPEPADTDDSDMKHIRFRQVFKDVPIWACEIIVHLDTSNHVYRIEGRYIPTPADTNTKPVLTQEEAFANVAASLKKTVPQCPDCQSELFIFPVSSSAPRLVYRILTKISLIEGWMFFIDAHTGEVLEKTSIIQTEKLQMG